jgi:hypothetical protein
MNNTYTKLKDGNWGIRVAGEATAGGQVRVTKKDGSSKIETVDRVLWTGDDRQGGGQISLCSIRASSAPRASVSCAPARRGGRRECEECGEFVTAGTRCWETGLLH